MERQESCKKSFTFTWKLENASYCLETKYAVLKSPAFVADLIDETKWKLGLYPRGLNHGDYIGVYLFRETDSKGAVQVEIYYELAFIGKDGSVLKSCKAFKHAFPKGEGKGWMKFEKREEVFIAKRSTFLPEDILTARCRIWKSVVDMPQNVQCFARTRIGVQKISFVWNLENFSTLESEKNCTYLIKSIESNAPLMSLDMLVTRGLGCEEIIRFEANPEDLIIKLSTLRLSIVDASGTKVECNQEEFWFDDFSIRKQFTFLFTKTELMAEKSLYLPNDILSLHWKWVFSKGNVLEEIEEIQYGCTTFESIASYNASNQKMMHLLMSHDLEDELNPLHNEHFPCDVKLKTSTSIFPAHKAILSATSSVFKAMFSNMEEEDSNCVSIEDLSDDSISRLLRYIYTACVEDLSWESAFRLYVAADKYAIFSLKNVCASYLKDNLSPSNACEVLLAADFHDDSDLKSAVQDFILKHDEDIINSDEWETFDED
ncbi:Speckle-type POZ protein B [Araneus ventricosus]|uniref:Speckle-type POZ protein B n=1 Tax=Araneus ventricosus TaxID=182803 RepID=A0A4Y2SXF4_ARAVE|nr:Speckle-type POZ protein B [Araneus ventricosus]